MLLTQIKYDLFTNFCASSPEPINHFHLSIFHNVRKYILSLMIYNLINHLFLHFQKGFWIFLEHLQSLSFIFDLIPFTFFMDLKFIFINSWLFEEIQFELSVSLKICLRFQRHTRLCSVISGYDSSNEKNKVILSRLTLVILCGSL